MGNMALRIERKLREAFQPERLVVADDSARHKGHAGWRDGGETHFRIEMTAAAFAGKSRLERQRAVLGVLREEMDAGVHALGLSLEASEPS